MTSLEHRKVLASLFGSNYIVENDQLIYDFGTRPPGGKVFGIFNYDKRPEDEMALPIQALHFTCSCWTHGEVVGGKQIIVELDLTQVGATVEYANEDGLFEVWRTFRIDFEDGLPDYILLPGPIKRWNDEKRALHATLHGFIKMK